MTPKRPPCTPVSLLHRHHLPATITATHTAVMTSMIIPNHLNDSDWMWIMEPFTRSAPRKKGASQPIRSCLSLQRSNSQHWLVHQGPITNKHSL